MGFCDLVGIKEKGYYPIIKGNIDENVAIIPILLKILTFVKSSGENSERVIETKICIANALWEIF